MLTPLEGMTLRAALKSAVREFFGARSYLEIDTPIAVVLPGTEVHLGYFRTAWRDLKGKSHDLYLRSSPELHMKQALSLGATRVFQMAPCFRNDGELMEWHHPEFTMLEWYETGIRFLDYVAQTEALLRDTAALMEKPLHVMGRKPFKLPPRIERLTVAAAFRQFAKIDLVDLDPDLAKKAAAAGCLSPRPNDDFETAFFKVLIEKIEPAMAAMGAAVLLDYPPSQAALAKVVDGVAKRFEFYLGRVELCNGFEELLDEKLNRERISAALSRRAAMGSDVPREDEAFYAALRKGLPPACGNALGFERWLAILAGEPGIAAFVPFRDADPYDA